ncbi:MAG: carbamate kinase, partial [Hyphomicrobiaceae bacterium]
RHAACLLTQVEVDPDDPAFANPTKFVGTFYTREQANRIGAELGWTMKPDSKRGFRHVVPSPPPKHICDISLVEVLSRRGTIVIAGGGGGIPVVRQPNGVRHGIEAVIDKDLTAALMASVLGMDTLLILTSVDKVAIDFGKPTERRLDRTRLSELRRYRDQGQFPPGSMGPKIDAAISFIERGGKRAIIAALHEPMAALEGRAGTLIIPDDD